MTETNYESLIFTDSFQHIGLCAETNKPIKQILTIDDGTGKLYEYELTKDLTWKEYSISPNFDTEPVEPTILDNTNINPLIDDPFDVVGYSYKDQDHLNNDGDTVDNKSPVDYNFYEDGVQIEKGEEESVQQILSVPREQQITQTVRYFTGWEVKEDSITKTVNKTNLPPQVCNTLDASCYTVPTHLFTSCSTDYEDTDPSTLSTTWELYYDANSTIQVDTDENGKTVKTVIYDEANPDWQLLETHTGFTFYWVYSREGRYKINEKTTDTDGDSSEADRFENIVFTECGKEEVLEEGVFKGAGEIEIEANTWQLIAMPLENSYWDVTTHSFKNDENIQSTIYNSVIVQLEDRYQVPAKDLFKVANAYIGDINKFYNYITGFTKETSEHNFPLVFIDTADDVQNSKIKKEIVGFWVKAYDMPFTIQWEIA